MRPRTLQQIIFRYVIGECVGGIPVQLVCNFCDERSLQAYCALLNGRTKLYASVGQMLTLYLYRGKERISTPKAGNIHLIQLHILDRSVSRNSWV